MNKIYHYEVLGVPPCADGTEIRNAFQALAKKYHPDTNGAVHTAKFTAITASYGVLKNSSSRAKYDAERVMLDALCGKCSGAGMVAHAKGFGEQVKRLCSTCKGTGRQVC